MNYFIKIILFLFCLLFALPTFASKEAIVLLKQEINNTNNDSVRLQRYLDLTWEYATQNTDSGVYYGFKAINLAKKLKSRQDEAYAYNFLAINYRVSGKYSLALKFAFKSLAINQTIKRDFSIAGNYNLIGSIYYVQKTYDKAKEYYKLCLDHALKANDTELMSVSYSNLGAIESELNNKEASLDYYLKSLDIDKKGKDEILLAGSHANIAGLYLSIYEKNKTANDLVLSEQNAMSAFNLYNKNKNEFGLATSYFLLANVNELNNKIPIAEEYYLKSESIFKRINDKTSLEGLLLRMSEFYAKSKKYEKALQYSYELLGLKDTLFSKESAEKMIEMEAKYQSEQKQKEIELHKLNIEQKDLKLKQSQFTQYAMAIGILLMFGLAFLAYKRYNEKQKANKLISLQKEKVELQNKLLQSKNHEITQSLHYAERIQRAIIPTEDVFRQMIPESFILFKPCDIVSGDFYWISDRSKYIYYATADCTGHGVPGGFMSMLGTALLNDIVDERKVEDPAEVLNLMREKIIHSLKQSGDNQSRDGMDMVLCRIDKDTLELQYAAANNGLYVVRAVDKRFEMDDIKSTLIDLPCDKMPIGIYGDNPKPFQNYKFQLQSGDILYTFTDGYADQFGGPNGKKMMYKRFEEKLLYVSSFPMGIQKLELEKYFNEWKRGMDQVDDVCIIGVKI